MNEIQYRKRNAEFGQPQLHRVSRFPESPATYNKTKNKRRERSNPVNLSGLHWSSIVPCCRQALAKVGVLEALQSKRKKKKNLNRFILKRASPHYDAACGEVLLRLPMTAHSNIRVNI